MINKRPVLSSDQFERAVAAATLTTDEEALIDFVRYTGVIDALILRKGLSLPAKPPALCLLADACEKLGTVIPDHYAQIMRWSAEISPDAIAWRGNLVCSLAYNSDGIELSPNAGTALYHTYVVHQELFTGLGF
ncbi:MAG: hypothetical protein CMN97_09935 [Synechococcus sp. NAT40]|nr:hypothetical protein [Synechococcus sp. NAT40]RZO12921.1 MAG: hypothetical protein EVB08_06980 [Synechococcus sp. MED-G135]